MLGSEDFIVIQALVQRGVYLCDIAQQLGVHPKTVRRALERGGPPRRRGGRRGSVLDPYRPVVDQLLAEGVWNAVVIWRELQAKGYAWASPFCATTSAPSVDCDPAGRGSGSRRTPGVNSREIGRPSVCLRGGIWGDENGSLAVRISPVRCHLSSMGPNAAMASSRLLRT